jgi:hypothetical protein
MRCTTLGIVALWAVFCAASQASAQLTFNITNPGAASPAMVSGFQEAAAIWSSAISTSVTINLKLDAAALPAGVTGTTNNFFDPYPYADVRAALAAGRTSTRDFSSVAALQAGSTFSMLINRTANNPAGVVSSTPYFDTGLGGAGQAGPENNSTIRITASNAKALGLMAGNDASSSGTITFSTSIAFDYNRADGINAGSVDFVGIAAHEIGHLLGFMSGVDVLDGNGSAPGRNDNQLVSVTPLDLFRFSSTSIGTGGGTSVIDWTVDHRAKYFSVDGGLTALTDFAKGATYGDGFAASHWSEAASTNGLMDANVNFGELLSLTTNDLAAFDVIGYTLVPEPSAALVLCAAPLLSLRPLRQALSQPKRCTT